MQARDCSGRRVSLLNDDQPSYKLYDTESAPQRVSYSAINGVVSQAYHPIYARSASSSPNTPELMRSDSYDSQASMEPLSPLTPNNAYDAAMTSTKRPTVYASSRSSSYEDDEDLAAEEASSTAAAPTERAAKRYPCRFRDTHGCEKTFTTSGHASRHSKIHTAEKAVHCTFHGCSKKFTRADNMKQHLETHFKDKSRSSASRPSLGGSDRRLSSSSKVSSRKHQAAAAAAAAVVAGRASPLASPVTPGGAWDMRPLNLPLLSRPSAARTPSSGLDALAMAIACQEGTI